MIIKILKIVPFLKPKYLSGIISIISGKRDKEIKEIIEDLKSKKEIIEDLKGRKEIIEDLKGKWEYKLTYNLHQNNQDVIIIVKGHFTLGIQADNNKKMFINGTREKILFISSSPYHPKQELEKKGEWHSKWIEYCHDGKIRFVYNFMIPNFGGDNSSENCKIRVFVESTNFCKGDTKIRGKQFPFSTNGTQLLLNSDNINTSRRIPHLDLEIPYSTFFHHAVVEAKKSLV